MQSTASHGKADAVAYEQSFKDIVRMTVKMAEMAVRSKKSDGL